ncbi:hypothetical protein DL770_008773 [Monosporascus sp. CRB-9-2]|nr:hypothetical protein DL770_008773 [Monosporascus sp. CRB-9-2]
MAPLYKKGETVRYKPVGGPDSNTSESTGKITDVLTEPGVQADRNVQASEDRPRYEVSRNPSSRSYASSEHVFLLTGLRAQIVNDNTGKTTTVYEDNILGTA